MENTTTSPAPTPGPWILIPAEYENTIYHVEGQSDYPTVAAVFFRNTDEEAEANARLIAAAPELLEVVDDLLAWVFDMNQGAGNELDDDERARYLRAETILRKADGRPPLGVGEVCPCCGEDIEEGHACLQESPAPALA